MAERLSASLRASDTLARLSGDEFLILLGGIRSDEAITAATSHVMQLLEQAFSLEELDVVVTTSLGIAVSPRDGTEVDVLLKNADLSPACFTCTATAAMMTSCARPICSRPRVCSPSPATIR